MKVRFSTQADKTSLTAPAGTDGSLPVAAKIAKPSGSALAGAEPPEADCWRLMAEGRGLTDAQAGELERRLQRDPLDLPSRLRLLGRTDGDTLSAAAFELLVGLIEHHPGSRIAGQISTLLPAFDSRSATIIAQWQRQIAAHPANVRVLGNAAIWLQRYSWLQPKFNEACKALFTRIRALEPSNPEWADHLGLVCFFEAGGGLGGQFGQAPKLRKRRRAAAARKAVDFLAVAKRLREEQGLDGNGILAENHYIQIAELACWRANQRNRVTARAVAEIIRILS